MKIAWIASEAFPFVKVGGLADVVGSLPLELARLGHQVRVFLPWYARLSQQPTPIGEVHFQFRGQEQRAGLAGLEREGVEFVFVGLSDFDRARIYGYPDDLRRFVRFAQAATAAALAWGARVVHAHDWQAALAPVLIAAGSLPVASVFTIHNLAYQGRWNPEDFFSWTGLPRSIYGLSGLEFFGDINLLKGALVFAERLTTVSPRYALEIQTPAFGEGLDGVLRAQAGKLSGILNGLDYAYWDPANDPHLEAAYTIDQPENKHLNKRKLTRELGLAEEGVLIGVVSRLAEQKGLDLLLAALPNLLSDGVALVVLGSGDPALEAAFSRAAGGAPRRLAFRSGYNERLAHCIYAAADALLIPSRFEPCGLTQMIGMRYGAVPLAHAVGGLADTIEDGRTGFLFEQLHPEGLLAAVFRFLHTQRPEIIRRAMQVRFDWVQAAVAYDKLYQEVKR